MKTPKFARTNVFRLGMLFLLVYWAAFVVLFAFVYWQTIDYLARAVDNALTRESATFAALPTADLGPRLNARSARDPEGPRPFALFDAEGKRIAGDRMQPTPPMSAFDRPFDFNLERQGNVIPFRGLARRLPSGQVLVVSQDVNDGDGLRAELLVEMAWGGILVALVGLVGAVVMGTLGLRRLETINRTTRAIMRGEIADRVPLQGTGDALDELSGNLNEMLDRVQGLMEGIRQVSNDIAHDLKTPLSRLKQRLETVRAGPSSAQDYEQAVDLALLDADLALSTFAALLRIAQIEAGTRRSNFADVGLSVLLTSLCMTYSAVAEDAGKHLSASIAPDIHVRGDRELLTQLFVNLIENALRHTQSGAQITMSLNSDDGRPVAEISDNGPGIPEAERGKVFKRFYRLERSRSTAGSGLGLALVAAIADLHGARIVLGDNKPGLKASVQFK